MKLAEFGDQVITGKKEFIEITSRRQKVVVEGYGQVNIPPKNTHDLKNGWEHTLNECRKIVEGAGNTGRMNMAGKVHPVSGVKFDANGFPIFESKFSMNLKPDDYLRSRGTHFDRANKALYDEIQKSPVLASKFTQSEIEIFKQGGVPKRFTWHHNQEPGLMQLVDRALHRQTGHNGGFSIWGPGN